MPLLPFIIGEVPADQVALLDCSHSAGLALLSYLMACAAGFTALAMANRVGSSRNRRGREIWRWVGACALGGGIWSMHFIAMLAFQAPLNIEYHLGITLFSLLVAIAVSYVVMWVIGRPRLSVWQYQAAAVLAGLGIATMHYSGMAAIRSPATQYYDPWLFFLSIGIAIAASLVALVLAFYFRERSGGLTPWLRLGSSLAMGGAIVSMHFTAMAALTLALPAELYPHALQLDQNGDTHHLLAGTIGILALFIIGGGIGAGWAEQRFGEQRAQLAQITSRLNAITHYDPLTSLLNGRAFIHMVERLLAIHPQRHRAISLLFIDVDNFKRVNDSLGHSAGDQLLQLVAQRIRAVLFEGDVLARFSGDEFCVMALLDHPEQAKALAERILTQLRPPFILTSGQLCLTASIGYSIYPQDGGSCDELLKHAGLALGHCKQHGRNGSRRFSSVLEVQAQESLILEQDLRRALNEDALEVHYQPIVASGSGEVIALEALARWQHPTQGPISPERFIALAERHGFIGELDLWVTRRACAELHALHLVGHSRLRVGVNCSALNLANPLLPRTIAQILGETGLSADALTLEVTENALMSNMSAAVAVLEEIRQLGVKISIDDFGTGYSSLTYLRKLPVDSLKVDRNFVCEIPNAAGDMAIVAAIVAMAHKLGLKVVAEGVESPEQLAFLRDNQCDLIQGYLFSKPLPLAQLKSWLEQREPALEKMAISR